MSEKEELKKIEAKIEIISEMKQKTTTVMEILKSDVIRMAGGVAGVKEASKSAADFALTAQREMNQLIQGGKISPDVNSFCMSFLNRMLNVINDKSFEVDRAHYAKLGELKAVEVQIENLTSLMTSLHSSSEKLINLISEIERQKSDELSIILPIESTPEPIIQEQKVLDENIEHSAIVKKEDQPSMKKKSKNSSKTKPNTSKQKVEKAKKNTFNDVWENVIKMKK